MNAVKVALLILSVTLSSGAAELRFADFGARGDGATDDTAAFVKFFAAAKSAKNRKVTIDPGVYLLEGKESVPLYSDLTVVAEGAEFRFPEKLAGEQRVMFRGAASKTSPGAADSSEAMSTIRWSRHRLRGQRFPRRDARCLRRPARRNAADVRQCRARQGHPRHRRPAFWRRPAGRPMEA